MKRSEMVRIIEQILTHDNSSPTSQAQYIVAKLEQLSFQPPRYPRLVERDIPVETLGYVGRTGRVWEYVATNEWEPETTQKTTQETK